MNSIFFISDAHLGFADPEEERRRENVLLAFLEGIRGQAEALYVVGDLFNFWFEYASVIPRQPFRILCSLDRLRKEGIPIHYIIGNHDCWMESFLTDELGIEVHREPVTPVLQGRQFFIGHGDGLAKKDIGYRILKKIIRSRLAVRLYKILHPDLAFQTALFFSRLSRNYRPIKDKDQEYASYAQTLFDKGFDCVVLAHTHRPFEYKNGHRIYINTGDWMTHFTYGRLIGGQLKLEQWHSNKSE